MAALTDLTLAQLKAALDKKEASAVEVAEAHLKKLDEHRGLNAFITVAALIVGFAQMVFLFNIFWSLRHGKEAGGNPWRAASLEWQTPVTPPGHGNWGKELPIVYRWAYDYSVPGAPRDFIAQDDPWPERPARPS